jgi:hypothetical protein
VTDDLDPSVLAAVVALADALGSAPPPCFTNADLWFATNLAPAIRACLEDCHAVPECAAYAEAVGADSGVWAGVERTRKRRGPAWTAVPLREGVDVA